MQDKHCYLFALEVVPLEVGKIYDILPLHCTLMQRFWIGLTPDELAQKVQTVLCDVPKILLTSTQEAVFGPQQVRVNQVEHTPEIIGLHKRLYKMLNTVDTEYTVPQYTNEGFKPHITQRPDAQLANGMTQLSPAVYLIEVNVPGYPIERHIRVKFDLR